MGSVTAWLHTGKDLPATVPGSQGNGDATSPADVKGQWLIIESELLSGEPILYVPDLQHLKAAREAHPRLVSYMPSEIEELYTHRDTPDLIAAVHRIKKKFGGHVRAGTQSSA